MATADTDKPTSGPIGENFGPYQLVRRLGVGGMAETFEAIRIGPSGFSQRVCLKVVLPFFRDRQDFRELFEREARLAAKLRHGNIVGVIDFGQVEGVTYMAVELVDGVDLSSLLDEQPSGRLSHEHVALIGHELAAALEHAHDPRREGSSDAPEGNAIVHRDLSPSNVLVSKRGEVLLTDFGLAKAITGTSRQQSTVKGKVPYMAPEQLRAEKLDGRADLFALGVVLFEALAGHRPFQGEHDPAIIMKILSGQRASVGEVAPSAPPELCEVVESLLSTDRDDRPANARAVLEMLDPFVPPPRMRRELGKMASEVRDLQATRSSPTPISGSDLTGTATPHPGEAGTLTPDAETAGQQPARRVADKWASRSGLGWALAAVIGIILAITIWPVAPVETGSPVAEGTSEEAPVEAAKPAAATTPEPHSPEAAGDAVPEAAAAEPTPAVPSVRPARLTVAVIPWGDVWINGKRWGQAPLKSVSLKPGRYKITVGQGKPSKSQTIRLREAQRKTVQFDLTK